MAKLASSSDTATPKPLNKESSDPSKWAQKSNHRSADWRECFNNYCRAHMRAKQDHGYFPKLHEYCPSKTHPRANASPASLTLQPKKPQKNAVDHASLPWTECYDHHCPAHLGAKKEWGWFPTQAKGARYRQTDLRVDAHQPKEPQKNSVDHNSLSWTVCYDGHCQAHLAAKKDWGWFPSQARYLFGNRQANGQPSQENGRPSHGQKHNGQPNSGQKKIPVTVQKTSIGSRIGKPKKYFPPTARGDILLKKDSWRSG